MLNVPVKPFKKLVKEFKATMCCNHDWKNINRADPKYKPALQKMDAEENTHLQRCCVCKTYCLRDDNGKLVIYDATIENEELSRSLSA
jgi:hypothetical protein